RSEPMYEGTIKNTYLGKTKHYKKRSTEEIEIEAQQRLTKWNKKEIKKRIKEEADRVWKENRKNLQEKLTALKSILISTLDINNRVHWKEELDNSEYKAFEYESFELTSSKPRNPSLPKKSFLDYILPFLWDNKMKAYE